MTITYKDADGIAGMRIAGKLASEVLDYLTPFVVPGVTTNALDKLAFDYITEVQGGIPAPLNYTGGGNIPYPKSICTSVNHQVCHGIPNDKQLKKGDVVNIDVTVIKNGWHGDTSRMFMVGEVSIAAKRLAPDHLRGHVARHQDGQARHPPGRHWPRHPKVCRGPWLLAWCASFAGTALAESSTKNHRCCTTAAPARWRSWSKA